MNVVVDASVALKWVFDEQGSDKARDLLSRWQTVAPTLVLVELGNAAWKMFRQGSVSRPQAELAVAELPRLFRRLVPIHDLHAGAFACACEIDHPVYDCYYLALAKGEGTRVITADRRLAERVRGTAWDVVDLL